jgi:RNA polymerase sigma-70 factor (ECF subfamily)
MPLQATTSFGLIERARKGDPDAFGALFARYRPRLAVLLYYRLGPELAGRVEVDDLLQETFLRAFRDIGGFSYSGAGSFFRWLAAIAAHVTADAGRYEGRERRRGELLPFRSGSNPNGPEPLDTQTPSRIAVRRERIERLLARLDTLPSDYREVLLLSKFEGLDTAEVADRLGKSREAVALLLHRALKRLRAAAASV